MLCVMTVSKSTRLEQLAGAPRSQVIDLLQALVNGSSADNARIFGTTAIPVVISSCMGSILLLRIPSAGIPDFSPLRETICQPAFRFKVVLPGVCDHRPERFLSCFILSCRDPDAV